MNLGYTKIGPVPKHFYSYVDTQFIFKEPQGFQPMMVVGLTSIPGRAWGFHGILEQGGPLYRQIPPQALAFSKTPTPDWTLEQSQLWNCYSYYFTVLFNPILQGIPIISKVKEEFIEGEYLFSATHLEDGWSDTPEQDKEFFFIKLNNGRLTIQPTNRITFQDTSFITPGPIPALKLNQTIFRVQEE